MANWFTKRESDLTIEFSKSFPIALIILDEKLRVVNFTDKWKEDFRLTDVSDNEIIGMPIDEALTSIPLFQPHWMRTFKSALTGKKADKVHDLFQFDQDSFDWILWSVMPWRDAKHNIIGVTMLSEISTHAIVHEKYYNLVSNIFCTANTKGYFLNVNPFFSQLLGYTEEELLKRSFYDFIHPDDLEKSAEGMAQLIKEGKIKKFENRYRCSDGTLKYLEWSAVKEPDSDIIYASGKDISIRKHQQETINKNKEMLDNLVFIQEAYINRQDNKDLFSLILERVLKFTDSTFGLIGAIGMAANNKIYLIVKAIPEMNWDEQTTEFYNQYAKTHLEIHELDNAFGETLKKSKMIIINQPDQAKKELSFPKGFNMKTYLGLPIYGAEKIIGMLAIGGRATGYNDSDAAFIESFSRIIGAIVEADINAAQRENVADLDKLTGLYSRSYFESRLYDVVSKMEKSKHEFGLVYLDLNRFKSINDTYGHTAGDALLESVAKRLLDVLDSNDIIGRVGGDEFAIIIANEDRVRAMVEIIDRIKMALAEPYNIQGSKLDVGVSIGVVKYPEAGVSVTDLQKHADFALYEAKKKTSKLQIYTKGVEKAYNERLLIENNIEKGFLNNEFYLLYQPQVDVKSKKIVGMEALLRWEHRELGLLAPDKFIPIIEEAGSAEILNLWVVRRIAKDMVKLSPELLKAIRVSFNFSPAVSSLHEHLEELIEVLKPAIENYSMQLEVTEQNIRDEQFNMEEFAKRLAEFGITISIDDFGKSFSSLRRLVELPITTIKIDIDFVANMLTDDKTKQVVISIINLGESLKLEVIAEGVETKEQLAALEDLGCSVVQGNYYYRPMTVEEIAKKLNL